MKFVDRTECNKIRDADLGMLHKPLIWMLLIPMLSNGLWIVCSDSSEVTAPDSLAQSDKNCVQICLMNHAAELGTICFALPGNTKNSASITIFDFGVAILPLEFLLRPDGGDTQFVTTSCAVYTDPNL